MLIFVEASAWGVFSSDGLVSWTEGDAGSDGRQMILCQRHSLTTAKVSKKDPQLVSFSSQRIK